MKFIQTSVLATALALGGGVAGAHGTNTGAQNVPQGQEQQQQGANTNTQQDSVHLAALDQGQIKDLQTQLKDHGFYKGQVDGILGNMTRGALVAYFQSQVGLIQQGRISDEALGGFGFAKNDIEKVRGNDKNTNNNEMRENTRGQGQQNQGQKQNNNPGSGQYQK